MIDGVTVPKGGGADGRGWKEKGRFVLRLAGSAPCVEGWPGRLACLWCVEGGGKEKEEAWWISSILHERKETSFLFFLQFCSSSFDSCASCVCNSSSSGFLCWSWKFASATETKNSRFYFVGACLHTVRPSPAEGAVDLPRPSAASFAAFPAASAAAAAAPAAALPALSSCSEKRSVGVANMTMSGRV